MFNITCGSKRLVGLLGALIAFCVIAVPGPSRAASQERAGSRTVLDISEGWRFLYGEQQKDVVHQDFDDSSWEAVSVPHTWNRVGEYSLERSEWANAEQGIGWYRLAYQAPPAAPGQRHYLDFGAVGNIADVWVNGVHVGQHKGAFSRFRFDITASWKPGEVNLIAVKADNTKPAVGSSTEHVIPLSGDFFIHGGIYRDVSLITTAPVGIDLLDLGGPGIYADATSITDDKADVKVLTRLRNVTDQDAGLKLVTTVRDSDGRQVAQESREVRVQPGTAEASTELTIESPRLWDGRRDPYLYSFTVDVREEGMEQGRIIDSVTQPLGIRSFRFDANEGFFLNGRHLKLHGVSRHQDRYRQGWALTPEDHAEDMALIVEMGANTVRHAHYQHADEWAEEANRAGMVVWAEVPFVTTPSLSGGEGSPEVWANAEQQARELIRQNYNHPSILMWSIGNEVDVAKGFGVAGDPPNPQALLEHLHKVAKEEDPHRPTAYADCCEEVGMVPTAGEQLLGITDVIGLNRYFGWYYPEPLKAREHFGEHLDKLHAAHPGLPMSISEYGGGGAPSQHGENPRMGAINFTGRPQPDDYLSFVHEQTWPVIAERNYVFASWVWNMFDFTSNLRKEGDSIDLNTKGLVTFDRKTRKDAFYYYKAQWNPEPMIHITGKRHVERPYPVMDVKAYSNATTAILTWNGSAAGEADCVEGLCVWKDVPLQPGENRARVSAVIEDQQVEDEALWIGPDPRIGLRIDAGNLASTIIDGHAFGSDHFVSGGTAKLLNTGGFAGMSLPDREVEAERTELYDHWRQGDTFRYVIPVTNGRWQVTIHSFDPGPAPVLGLVPDSAMTSGSEANDHVSLSVIGNGQRVVPALDVREVAGGPLKGISRTFPVTVEDGVLTLDFDGNGGRAVVSAIEVEPAGEETVGFE